MRKAILCSVLAIFILITSVGLGFAEEAATDSSRPVFSITPRLWYMMRNMNSYNDSLRDQYSTQQMNMFMYGGTATIAPRSLESTDFLLTVLHGKGSAQTNIVSVVGATNIENIDEERTDLEFLVRHRIGETNANIFYGARYIYWYSKKTMLGPGWYNVTGTNTKKRDSNILYPEIGVGYSSNITKDGRHRFFANIALGYGYAWEEDRDIRPDYVGEWSKTSWSTYLLDINAGYEFTMNKYVSAHARYRAYMIKIWDPSENYIGVFHGPELGFKVSF